MKNKKNYLLIFNKKYEKIQFKYGDIYKIIYFLTHL